MMILLPKAIIQIMVNLMSYFDQFIQYRALKFKFDSMGSVSLDDVEASLRGGSILHSDDGGKTMRPATLEEAFPIPLRNVCAKLSVDLVDRLDKTLSILSISKREFIEMSLIEALNRVDQELLDIDAFEYINRMDAQAAAQEESE